MFEARIYVGKGWEKAIAEALKAHPDITVGVGPGLYVKFRFEASSVQAARVKAREIVGTSGLHISLRELS